MNSVLQIDLSGNLKDMQGSIEQASHRTKYVECYHSKSKEWSSLIHLAQTDEKSRELLVSLAQAGYLVYRAPATGSSLVHRSAVGEVWAPLKRGDYVQSPDGIVYEFTSPRHEGPVSSLVVVMSSVAKNRFSQSLDRHFARMIPNLSSLVGGHTAILRVADLDGVVGGYYLPTVRDPHSSERIQELILTIASNFGVPKERIVLYGASKGASGALYNALALDVRSVSVDPITSLEGRNRFDNDPYLSSSAIYPASLDAVFNGALSDYSPRDESTRHAVITAPLSKENRRTRELALTYSNAGLRVIESQDPHILHHHEVSRNTVSLTLALLNGFAQGLPLELPAISQVF